MLMNHDTDALVWGINEWVFSFEFSPGECVECV